jgi:hypothetical protein
VDTSHKKNPLIIIWKVNNFKTIIFREITLFFYVRTPGCDPNQGHNMGLGKTAFPSQKVAIEWWDANLLKPTGYGMHQQVEYCNNCTLCPHCVVCFVFVWEQTATCATYSINWLGFITEMKSVYSAVRTGSLNKAVCACATYSIKCLQRGTDWDFK